MEYLIYVLFALFVVLQVIDGYLTVRALKLPGMREANPIMAWFMEKLGVIKGLVVAKGLVVLFLLYMLPTTFWQVYVFLNAVYIYVIWKNWQRGTPVTA